MRGNFEKQLDTLNGLLVDMGTKMQQSMDLAIAALKEQNIEKATMVIDLDDEVDAIEKEIEKKCISMIALQQPIAKDLRRISSIWKIITDIERMGDNAVNIAKITISIGNEPLIKPLIDIPKMTSIIKEMIRLSLDSFLSEDIELAKQTIQMDDKVDALYESIYQELELLLSKNPSTAKQVLCLVLVARYLERIADHATNICERIIYMVVGEDLE